MSQSMNLKSGNHTPAPATEPSATTVERRAHPRQAVAWAGKIVVQNFPSMSCAVLNVSERGARLRLRQPIELPSHFNLAIDRFGAMPVELLGQDQGVVVRVGFLEDGDAVRKFFRNALTGFRAPRALA